MNVLKTMIVVALTFLSTSCGDDDGQSNSGNADSFSAKIDGADYNPPSVTGFRYQSTNVILLTGATGTNEEQIQIFVPADIMAGTYTSYYDPLNSPYIQAYYQPGVAQDADDAGNADTGSLTITLHNVDAKTIEGNFNFITNPAVNSGTTWNITEGSFKIIYTDL